jgi:galactokinase
MNRLIELKENFARHYQAAPEFIARAPGRVNLIGEHTDNNDGWVLPLAIDREVLIAARRRDDARMNIIALDREQATATFSLAAIEPAPAGDWSNYLRGVAALLMRRGYRWPGLDLMITGDIPMGAGLSSSAALLIATGLLLETAGGFTIDRVELAQLCRAAEHEFCGVKSGIMDQFIIALARAGHALLIDCRALSYQHVALPADCRIVVCNTMKPRELQASAYNERRAQCEEATHLIAAALARPCPALRDVTMADFALVEGLLPPLLQKRARHVISENERVMAAVIAAQQGDLPALGRLLNESHESLRALYQVSCCELDTMVEIARQQPGLYGARLTGAGFGGCTVNLVAAHAAEDFPAAVAAQYQARTKLTPQIYLVSPQGGAEILNG